MTSVTNRIDLKSSTAIFDRLRTSRKIKLPGDLTDSIDGIISNNITSGAEGYANELGGIRWVLLIYTKNNNSKKLISDSLLQKCFSKMVCAEVSQRSDNSKPVYHQTVNAQNSMLTREIHDQGKIFIYFNISYYFLT